MGTIDPKKYAWLDKQGQLPRMIVEARKLVGTDEALGEKNNPIIMGWAADLKLGSTYSADAVPWCGLFIAFVAKAAGKTPPKSPLWSLNWSKFGVDAGQPALGDVLTFIRPGGGHVALYIGEDSDTYHVLGGNQSNSVCYTRIDKKRLKAARRPAYMQQPASVRPYIVKATGKISDNEQ